MKYVKMIALSVVSVVCISMVACGNEKSAVGTDSTSVVAKEATSAEGETQDESNAVKSESDAVADDTETLKIIGEVADGENVSRIILSNESGQDITGIEVKDSTLDTYSENYLTAGSIFAAGEKGEFYFDATAALNAQMEEQAAITGAEMDMPIFAPEYTVRITLENGDAYELHAFPMSDAEKITVKFSEDVLYIEYSSIETNEALSTKDSEVSIAENEALFAEQEADA